MVPDVIGSYRCDGFVTALITINRDTYIFSIST
jgi:hypothetical protein